MAIHLLLLSATFAFLSLVKSYREQAQARGWPIGMLFWEHDMRLKFSALGGQIALLTLAWVQGPWWYLLVVPICGFVLSFFILQLFKSWTQLAALLGSVFGLIACVLVVR